MPQVDAGRVNIPLLVSGIPGAGKTSVVRALASRAERSVHVETDIFFGFVHSLIDPSLPGAGRQNDTVVRAWCRAAGEYRNAGYRVFIDGVIGPWYFDIVREVFDRFDYVVLDASLAVAHARNLARGKTIDGGIIDRMHRGFETVRRDYARHVVTTEDVSIDDIVNLIEEVRADGRYTV